MRFNKFLSVSVLLSALFLSTAALAQNGGPTVRFHTTQGDIDVILTPEVAPLTVANFLSYVNKGAYDNSIFHRSVPGFIIQAGGFQLVNHARVSAPEDPAVKNEFKTSNTRGTIAMAKLGSDPNSATNQWFFNLANNTANLDKQNGGFTVFGRIANLAGFAVMDKIAGLPVYNAGSPFDALPLSNYSGTIQDSNYVLVTSIVQVPSVVQTGIRSAASYAATNNNGVAPGELLTIFGSSIGPATLASATVENGVLPTTVSGTRVLFDGVPAPLLYTSSGQIGLIAPQSLATKPSVGVVVEYQNVQTGTFSFSVVPANPGIFTLNSSGTGDGVIIRPNGTVINSDNPAVPDEILVLYGEGYGAANQAPNDGAIVGSMLPVPATKVMLLIDGQAVDTQYAGGAPSLVNGVLQVNFKVPGLTAGSHQIQLQVGDKISPPGVILQTK